MTEPQFKSEGSSSALDLTLGSCMELSCEFFKWRYRLLQSGKYKADDRRKALEFDMAMIRDTSRQARELPEEDVTIRELLSIYRAHKAREAELAEQYGKKENEKC